MTPTNSSSTGASWARFRFSIVGSLLSSPPARNAEDSHPRPCRQNLVASGNRTRCPFHGCHHRAVVLHGAAPTRRPRGGPAPRPAQGLRQGNPLRRRRGATHAPVPRLPALELPTALRQPGRLSEGQSLPGTAPLLFHGQTLHAGARPGAQTDASAQSAPGRSARGREAPRRARSAATKPSMSGRCGTSISTTDRRRSSLRAASGCGRSRWASSTTIRDYAATSSGISRRRRKTSCMASPRRSRSVACRVRS